MSHAAGLMQLPQTLARGKAARSSSATRCPARARTSAAREPAGAAPTMTTSWVGMDLVYALKRVVRARRCEMKFRKEQERSQVQLGNEGGSRSRARESVALVHLLTAAATKQLNHAGFFERAVGAVLGQRLDA